VFRCGGDLARGLSVVMLPLLVGEVYRGGLFGEDVVGVAV